MWDLPGPGLEPMSPALAGGFLTTAPPGKSLDTDSFLNKITVRLSHTTSNKDILSSLLKNSLKTSSAEDHLGA